MVLTRSARKTAVEKGEAEPVKENLFEESDTEDGESGDSDVKMFYALAVVGVMICISFFASAPPLPGDPSCGIMNSAGAFFSSFFSDKAGTIEQSYRCLKLYQDSHANWMLAGFFLVYMVAQAFAIPGPPLLLTILSGAFYPWHIGILLSGACACAGSSLCFLISLVYGKGVVAFLVKPELMDDYKKRLSKASTTWDITMFMLLCRVTPVPNILVNLASPLLGVPLYIFAPTTFIGQIPLNSVHVTTGYALKNAGTYQADTQTATIIAGIGTLVTIAAIANFVYSKKKKGS